MNVSLLPNRRPLLSILVKALNEEENIQACLRSALAAGDEAGCDFEVILADAISSDATVSLAGELPVRIVQLLDAKDRGCGSGVQLGYQHARGEFVFLLDGDMTVCNGFMPAALAALRASAEVAGVAGLMAERGIRNVFDQARLEDGAANEAKDERWLNGGGLYRRAAIERCGGYAADRNLKGWEEADLGMRLRSQGWRLRRLPIDGVQHDGHTLPVSQLLRSMWRSGRAASAGVLARKSLGQPWLADAMLLLLQPVAALAWWLIGLLCLALVPWFGTQALWLWTGLSVLILCLMPLRKRSLVRGMTSVLMWHYLAAGLLCGLWQPRQSELAPIPSVELSRGRA
jgi:GT2 family glycosyltransferase